MDAFRWRLAETIAWCRQSSPTGNVANSLRSYYLRPIAFRFEQTIEQMQALVEDLAEERVRMLHWYTRWHGWKYPNEPAKNLSEGRLLIYDPGGQLADGAAEVETEGFFNLDNEPPWDAWICFIDNKVDKANGEEHPNTWHRLDYYVVSWIPPSLIEMVTAGINVNAEACIAWATDVDTLFTRQLKDAGLLS